jgi:hypothetical protein
MNLQLSLKKKWFEMTAAGIKTEDYREVNHYWIKRLMNKKYNKLYPNEKDAFCGIIKHPDRNYLLRHHSKPFTTNTMTLGYPKSTDTDRIRRYKHAGIEIREGNPDFGAEPGKIYFVIKHGEQI